jgi:hypothetical protein
MNRKDFKLVLYIALAIIIVWLIIKFLSSVPFWIWAIIAAIAIYLNWTKIKRFFR